MGFNLCIFLTSFVNNYCYSFIKRLRFLFFRMIIVKSVFRVKKTPHNMFIYKKIKILYTFVPQIIFQTNQALIVGSKPSKILGITLYNWANGRYIGRRRAYKRLYFVGIKYLNLIRFL